MKLEMLEKDIVRQILEYFRFIGAIAGKTKTTGIFDPRRKVFRKDPFLFSGFPDVAFFYKNHFGFVEAKSATGRQSDEQVSFEKLCRASGIPYILARSVEDVQKFIEALENLKGGE
jgi:hypothetical protein